MHMYALLSTPVCLHYSEDPPAHTLLLYERILLVLVLRLFFLFSSSRELLNSRLIVVNFNYSLFVVLAPRFSCVMYCVSVSSGWICCFLDYFCLFVLFVVTCARYYVYCHCRALCSNTQYKQQIFYYYIIQVSIHFRTSFITHHVGKKCDVR